MIILGIETSCDETAAAVVEDGVKIHSNIIASSLELHKKTGGIIPENAAREQIKCIIPVIDEAISGFNPENIDAIAVTYGPGLIGSLLVGIETAKTLAYIWKKPIIPVNHLVGHIYANFVGKSQISPKFTSPASEASSLAPVKSVTSGQAKLNNIFPAMVLIVSGGHTELILMNEHGEYKYVGGTRDDAAGEAFDKIARILGLGYPGGPSIQKTAEKYIETNKLERHKEQVEKIKLPRPMMGSGDLDFSFSGLKTHVLNLMKNIPSAEKNISEMAYEVQEAICDVLVKKTFKAASEYKVKSILLAGGVTANLKLREKLINSNEKLDKKFILSIPEIEFCTDNAVIIASAGFFNYSPIPISEIIVDPGLEIG